MHREDWAGIGIIGARSERSSNYPEGLRTVESGSVLFGFDSGSACIAKKARDTASRAAAAMIAGACRHRYGPNKPYVPFPNPN
jgi:hypothetical protein